MLEFQGRVCGTCPFAQLQQWIRFSFGLGVKKSQVCKVRVAGDYAGSLAQTAAQAWRLKFFFQNES